MRPDAPQPPASVASSPGLPIHGKPGAMPSVRTARIKRAATFGFPFVVVLSYLFVEYGRPATWIPPLSILHLGAIVSILGVGCLLMHPPRALPRLAKYMFAFLAVMALGIPMAGNRFYAFVWTKNFAIFLITSILPLMIFVNSFARVRVLFRFWIAVNVLVSVYGLLHHGRGIGAFLADENDFCLVTNMAAPYAFFLLSVATSAMEKTLLGGSLAIFLAGSVMSWSRGGFLGLIAAGIFCWIRSPKKVASALAILMLGVGVFLASPPSYWHEMKTIETSTNENDTGYYRLYYWGVAWREFLDHPLMGVGPYNYQFSTGPYESEHEKGRGHHLWGKASHSLYFTLLPEYGLLGTLLYAGIVIAGWRDRARIRKRYRTIQQRAGPSPELSQLRTLYYLTLALDASLITFLVTGAFISVLYYPHFWLLTAFTGVVHYVFHKVAGEVEPSPALEPRRSRFRSPSTARARAT